MVDYKRTTIRNVSVLLILFLQPPLQSVLAQEQGHRNDLSSTWFVLQAVPSVTWTSLPAQTNFAFEWEAAPVLYSFGMTKLDPPWHFFNVTQPERFTGSIEFTLTTQLYTSKVGSTYWGFSGQLLTHLPLIEHGEHLGLNLGIARYTIGDFTSHYLVGGFSTLFGFLHYNLKYSPWDKLWMHSLELRFF